MQVGLEEAQANLLALAEAAQEETEIVIVANDGSMLHLSGNTHHQRFASTKGMIWMF